MKKLSLISCMIISFSSSGQISLGIKAGVSVPDFAATYTSTYAPTDENNFGKQRRIVAGVFADIPLNKKLFFRPGAELVGKCASINLTSNGVAYEWKVKINTVDFPINLIYKAASAGKQRVLVGGGIVPGIFIRSNYNISVLTLVNLGLNAMAGYEFPVGVSFNVNYNYGLLNVVSSPVHFQSLRLHYLGLTVGYFF